MSKKKGDRNEREAREILTECGWTTESPNSTPYPQEYGVDFFGLFDIMAVKQYHKPLFIQVKTNGMRGITTFSDKCIEIGIPFDHVDIEYWGRYDIDGWKISKILPEEYNVVVDERNKDCDIGELAKQYKGED